MQNTNEIMNIMHEKHVNLVGTLARRDLAIENGKLWPKGVSSEGPENIENSLDAAYILQNESQSL